MFLRWGKVSFWGGGAYFSDQNLVSCDPEHYYDMYLLSNETFLVKFIISLSSRYHLMEVLRLTQETEVL
jgi:hypothetical protein